MALSKRSKYSAILILLVLAGILAFAWTRFQAGTSIKPVRNIILISIDTCRADHLGCYGFSKPTTPNIDAVARESVLFENTVTPVPLTLPAHTSMLTGTNPVYHGVHHNLGYQVSPDNLTLAEILKDRGYTTAAFIGAFVLDSKFGLDQGFDTYNDDFEEGFEDVIINQRRAAETSRLAGAWLEKHQKDKSFLFLHFYDPHFTYDPPEPAASQFPDDPYSGEIAYTDTAIGQVIDKLKELDLYESSLIIITADHGEMLGEHGEVHHGFFLYRGSLHVPLMFKLPGKSKGRRVDALTGIVDIVPTICGLLNIDVPSHVRGKDLSSTLEKKTNKDNEERFFYCETQEPSNFGGNILLGVVSQRYKYIQTTRPELYDRIKDPGETTDLSLSQPKRARMMKATLARIMEESAGLASEGSKMQLDEEAVKKLGALGYVGNSVGQDFTFDQSLPDPKDLIGFVSHCQHGFNLLHVEKHREAIAEYDKAIAINPEFPNAHYNRGYSHMSLKEYDKAIADFTRAIERAPDYVDAYNNRSTCYRHKGDDPRAISDYTRLIELIPTDSNIRKHIGLALIRVGKPEEAVVHLRKGLELKPDWPVVLNALAWVLATHREDEIHDPIEALELARRACELTDNTNAITLHTLAAAYAENDRFDKAAEICRKALDLALKSGRKDHEKKFRTHLKLFEAGKPVP
jgi:arylsulfatase A-like enzyme